MPDPEDTHAAAEAAASVRFQPAEDSHVCPACYHPPHWGGMCALCLCFKVHATDSIEAAADQPNAMIDDLGQVFYPDNDEDAAAFAEDHGAWFLREQPAPEPRGGRHRREVPKSLKLARLRKMWRRG